MTSQFTELAIDCADPGGLAWFWCSVLDYVVQDEDDGIVTIGSPMVPDGENHLGPVPPTLTFAHVPVGKTAKNRLHLDVRAAPGLHGDERMAAPEAGCERRRSRCHPLGAATSRRLLPARATS
jgi:hypothetical protein